MLQNIKKYPGGFKVSLLKKGVKHQGQTLGIQGRQPWTAYPSSPSYFSPLWWPSGRFFRFWAPLTSLQNGQKQSTSRPKSAPERMLTTHRHFGGAFLHHFWVIFQSARSHEINDRYQFLMFRPSCFQIKHLIILSDISRAAHGRHF